MAWITILNELLDMRPVQYLLLLSAVVLLLVSGFSMARQKALSLQLDKVKASNTEYIAAAAVNKSRTEELEKRVKASAEEIQQISQDYTAKIDRIKSSRLTSDTCAGMIAESIKLMQEGEND